MSASSVDILDLTGGGRIEIVAADQGEYFMMVSKAGMSFSITLASLDVLGLRSLTGDVVMKAQP